MNKTFFVNILICFLLLLVSCQDKDITDKLQGKWQLKTVEQFGTIIKVDTVWYNFQSKALFMYQIYQADKDTFMHWYGYKIQPEEYTMELELAYDPKIPLSGFLPYTDWETDKRTFIIEKINGKHLVLCSDDKTYSFVKFE